MSEKTIGREPFRFKQFSIIQDQCAMKVGTDGIMLGTWAAVDKSPFILDIGTGTGLIAIMLAQRSKASQIHAVEVDEKAFKEAALNMQNAPWKDRLKVFHIAIQDYAKTSDQQYDLIVSNPPFFLRWDFQCKPR